MTMTLEDMAKVATAERFGMTESMCPRNHDQAWERFQTIVRRLARE